MREEILKVVMKFTHDISLANSIATAVYNLIYDPPEENVLVVKESFKKRKVEGGYEYKFFTDGRWETIWNFVPKYNF